MEKGQHNGQSAQQIPADMLVMVIGEQLIEMRVIRGQLAQTQAALAAANARIWEMGKELAETKAELELRRPCPADGGLGGQGGPGGLGGPAEPESEAVEDAVDAEPMFPDCAGVNYNEAAA